MVLRNKSSATPVSSSNWQGLQAMSVAEIKNYIAQTLTVSFGANSDGTGTGELNITTNNTGAGTAIGTFVDTDRQEATGTHPATGAFDTITYYAKQVTAAATESITNRPVKFDNGIREMTDSQIDTEILDYAINAMVSETAYTAGQYRLQATAPVGGTWVSRYTLTDVANGGNTTTYLWQKTAATSLSDSNLRPLKLINTKDIKEMSSAEILQMLPSFRNRIIDNNVGTYKIQSSAPVGGTWVQMGDEFADTREQVTPQNYAGNYVGSYAGTFAGSRNYTGTYAGAYSGSYANNFSGGYVGPANYSGTYTGNFTGTYTGTYAGSRNYTGAYAGNFSGNYIGYYSGSRNYAGNYAGTYTGFYSTPFAGTYTLYYGGFVGGNFLGYYIGSFAGNYVGYYAGSRNYAAAYAGTYLGTYTGFFSGSRNYAGNYVGNYSGTYAGNFTGTYAGTATYTGTYQGFFTGSYTGYYSGSRNYAGNYVGNYSGTYSGTYSGATVIATKDTISTVKLWVRTA
ncbi:hypothetical protein EBV26_04980 [bacterium]|nr:hypothetical protein [bacterium]